jgi:MoaA/NifB/PqqE/SkfB family radical SAM enzyme
MCPRRINGGPINPNFTSADIDLATFKKWFSVDFISQLHNLFMCGNLGDPVVARDTLEVFKYIREINTTMSLSMHTNGSARSAAWWKELAKLNVVVIFGIDGLEDTHHLYRVDTSWKTIIKNAKTFIGSGGQAEWHMIVFKHNEHQIADCESLSKSLGFSNFQTKHTSRFENNMFIAIDEHGRSTHILKPSSKSKKITYMLKNNQEPVNINCKSVQYKQIYVAADGHIGPCCWFDWSWKPASRDHRIDYMDKIGLLPNLNSVTIKEVFDSGYFNSISNTWKDQPLLECAKQCGNVDKLRLQFNE